MSPRRARFRAPIRAFAVTLFSIIAVTLARAAAEPLAVLVDAGASGLPPERIRQAIRTLHG